MASNQTILVVDDETDLLAVAKKFLESEGYEVHAFDRPESAFQHVKQGCTDCTLVISDIRMPSMSGFELVRRLRDLRPEIKAILMSSFVIHRGEFEKVMPSLEVDEFVMKPFTKDDLVRAVRKCRKENIGNSRDINVI